MFSYILIFLFITTGIFNLIIVPQLKVVTCCHHWPGRRCTASEGQITLFTSIYYLFIYSWFSESRPEWKHERNFKTRLVQKLREQSSLFLPRQFSLTTSRMEVPKRDSVNWAKMAPRLHGSSPLPWETCQHRARCASVEGHHVLDTVYFWWQIVRVSIWFHPHMSVIRIKIKCISIELLGV